MILLVCSGEGIILSSSYKFCVNGQKKKKDTTQSLLFQKNKKVHVTKAQKYRPQSPRSK